MTRTELIVDAGMIGFVSSSALVLIIRSVLKTNEAKGLVQVTPAMRKRNAVAGVAMVLAITIAIALGGAYVPVK
jgi:hypothetical protein